MAGGPTLCGAVANTFAADAGAGSLTALVPQGLWVGEVPEKYDLPLVALLHGGEKPQWQTERKYREEGKVRFVVIAAGLANAEAIAARVKVIFDQDVYSGEAAIAIDDARVKQFQRMDYQVERTGDRDASDRPVFKVTLFFDVDVSRVLPS